MPVRRGRPSTRALEHRCSAGRAPFLAHAAPPVVSEPTGRGFGASPTSQSRWRRPYLEPGGVVGSGPGGVHGLCVLRSAAAVDRGFLATDAAPDVGGRVERPAADAGGGARPAPSPTLAPPDAAVDAGAPDLPADVLPPPDSARIVAPDQPIARTALLVVGNSSVTPGGETPGCSSCCWPRATPCGWRATRTRPTSRACTWWCWPESGSSLHAVGQVPRRHRAGAGAGAGASTSSMGMTGDGLSDHGVMNVTRGEHPDGGAPDGGGVHRHGHGASAGRRPTWGGASRRRGRSGWPSCRASPSGWPSSGTRAGRPW